MRDARHILDQLRGQGATPCGISADSRRIGPGDIFAAMPGMRSDGRAYIKNALAQGAAGVVWESAGAGNLAEQFDQVPNVPVANLQALSGELAHLIYDRPSEKLWLCGITGTNGKTSVSQWIAQSFELLGRRCGVIGTLGSGLPGALRESANTTPDAISVHATLAELLTAGAQACAMEVSSIGLDQGRVNAAHFDTVVFTNLTRDHLEYHGSMEAYGAAKARLFALPGIKTAVINLDDEFGLRLCADLAGKGVRRIGYSLAGDSYKAALADEVLTAQDLSVGGAGLRFCVLTAHGDAAIAAPLLGRFNAANLLAVLGALLGAGIPLQQAVASFARLTPPPGRLQIVASVDAATVVEPLLVVDYAHTPDALEQALTTLREVATARGGRLLCVFGCGGERDPGKRPLMGRVAERLADALVITSDNPRSEEPLAIIGAIRAGMNMNMDAPVEVDRVQAIRQTVKTMSGRDVLLIAGKGHEPYQEIAGRRLPYSDLEQAHIALTAWRASA